MGIHFIIVSKKETGLSGIKPNGIIILLKKNIICVERVIYLKKILDNAQLHSISTVS